MVNMKKLIEMTRRWRKSAAIGRTRRIAPIKSDCCPPREIKNQCAASRGHLFVYMLDKKKFMVPIAYLQSDIFRELFKMSEDEFGLPRYGPITLPCDAASMEYIISSLTKKVSKELERNLILSVVNSRWTTECSLLQPRHGDEHLSLYALLEH